MEDLQFSPGGADHISRRGLGAVEVGIALA
jgi:hypothetical protein